MFALACFGAFFPAVIVMVGTTFLYVLVAGLPMARARREIMLTSTEQFLTPESVEREMAKRYPRMYTVSMYMPLVIIALGVVTFILSWMILY